MQSSSPTALSSVRSIHSLPTRRSSYLTTTTQAAGLPAFASNLFNNLRFIMSAGGETNRMTQTACHDDQHRSEEQRLNSSHVAISYAVVCLKKKTCVI